MREKSMAIGHGVAERRRGAHHGLANNWGGFSSPGIKLVTVAPMAGGARVLAAQASGETGKKGS